MDPLTTDLRNMNALAKVYLLTFFFKTYCSYEISYFAIFEDLITDIPSDTFLQIMRQRRIDRGALTLASAEVKFQIDTETHDPLDIGICLLLNALSSKLKKKVRLNRVEKDGEGVLRSFAGCNLDM